MAKWIEYTGSYSHEALKAAKHGFLLKGNYFEGSIKYTIRNRTTSKSNSREHCAAIAA